MLASQIFNSGLVRKIDPGPSCVLTVSSSQVMAEMVELRRINPSGKRSTTLPKGYKDDADRVSSQYWKSAHRHLCRHYSRPRSGHLQNLF